jgi:hypothetical protein
MRISLHECRNGLRVIHPREPNRHFRYSHFSRRYTVTFSQCARALALPKPRWQKLPVAIAPSTEDVCARYEAFQGDS